MLVPDSKLFMVEVLQFKSFVRKGQFVGFECYGWLEDDVSLSFQVNFLFFSSVDEAQSCKLLFQVTRVDVEMS